ncbi:RtcB family protein [Ignavigranum ruoffiae]|uniref:RtcB family protein n=1 Tax=Ignavigranum ruoffiae TaxID=89093 RepID=UPI0023533DFF|nr:RtcB family protein [Ignavigranum ruoffiae]
MIIKGKNGEAKVFTDMIEEEAIEQIKDMMDEDITQDSIVRIMPDVHAGKGSTVGTTIKLNKLDRVSPNVVGVDIGCGITAVKIKGDIDLEKLDQVINEHVPSGFNVREATTTQFDYDGLTVPNLDTDYLNRSLGTLGGGNHYIELAKDLDGEYWLSVHSGSRNLGVKVAKHYQDLAVASFKKKNYKVLIDQLKVEGREKEIEQAIKEAKANEKLPLIPYLTGKDLRNYLNDMQIATRYALENRNLILLKIVLNTGWDMRTCINSTHNYIDMEDLVIRKGATSAKYGELAIIPINMKDGTLIVKGKGNRDWNFSAPHGAGRQMSRRKARESIKLEDYQKQMEGIYTTSVGASTLDEAPEAYKPINNLIENIKDTVEIVTKLKPVYNFKAH